MMPGNLTGKPFSSIMDTKNLLYPVHQDRPLQDHVLIIVSREK